ncbi:ACP S-malonyltransferase [Streptomyces longwoodensis]|uniref:ACP S-malonyltransferase n=1 Tax=Streptomyces longwoodensis TaxID=68231 RepID=UPI0037F18C27
MPTPAPPPSSRAAAPPAPSPAPAPGAGLALLFPGQGAQRPGMGAPWRDTAHWAVVEDLSEAAGRDLGELLLHADAERLTRTDNAQLATFTLEMVLLDALRSAVGDLAPTVCAGHSLGEYAALTAAGVLTPRDAVRLVAERGAAMAEAARLVPGTMAVLVGPDMAPTAAALVDARGATAPAEVWVANVNGPGQVVVSGRPHAVAALTAQAVDAGARALPLRVGGAFHSPLMAAALPRLTRALAATPLAPGRCPIVANVDGRAHHGEAPALWRDLLRRQLLEPVRWSDSMTALHTLTDGRPRLVELGPGSALTGLARRLLAPDVPARSAATPAQLAGVVATGWY